MRSREVFTISGIVLLDALGFGMILPLLPYYAESYGASDTLIGLLVASYAIGQFVGAPILGRLSDQWGRKPILAASVLGSCLGFLIWGFATELGSLFAGLNLGKPETWALAMLFFGRTLDGLSGGNLPLAQAYVADVTDEQERGRGLATISAALGLGFVLGPLVGGILSQDGHYELPSRMAAGLALLNALAVMLVLPEAKPQTRPGTTGARFNFLSHSGMAGPVRALLLTSLLYFFVFTNFTGTFTLYTLRAFDFSTNDNGKLLAMLALLAALCQVFVVGRLIQRHGELKLLKWGLPAMALMMISWGLAPTAGAFVAVTVGVAGAAAILNVSLRSYLTKLVPPEEMGLYLGYQASVESACRIFGPLTGATLIELASTGAPGLCSGILLLLFAGPLVARVSSGVELEANKQEA